jgi:hypothetical protein
MEWLKILILFILSSNGGNNTLSIKMKIREERINN